MGAKILQQWKTINTNLTDGTQLIARQSHQIRCFTALGGRHEQVVCITKRDKRSIHRDVGVEGLERPDGLQEHVLLLAFGSKGVPNGQRDGAVVVNGSRRSVASTQTAGQHDRAKEHNGQSGSPSLSKAPFTGHDRGMKVMN